ncbi:hypothetical protein GCM10009841_14400 [Microlunatus panaciterrae]
MRVDNAVQADKPVIITNHAAASSAATLMINTPVSRTARVAASVVDSSLRGAGGRLPGHKCLGRAPNVPGASPELGCRR